ncbi:hypothetical protein PGT21_026957 [Puccinia graminis f. sp. tritici]|uniref:2,4-dienoyl-CoA reductase [(3E)-enoyl-CoA-producing] n=1 Tax=Puccinia graminis f. sp. tritici TaxID=56615 RepID=A0A5B0P9L0_PUCGR|nr:hypothetical protein PGT21_026957 [Puccinia graminis f. sp. tritici]
MGIAGTPLQAHVSSAKAGVDALSQSVAVEFGPHGIRSNVIAPGPIGDTEGMSRLSTPESQKNILKNIPLQRFGTRGKQKKKHNQTSYATKL